MSIRCRASRLVYENRWMRVREDEIERADGSRGVYGVVEKPDFALIVPVDTEDRLWLVEQFRYPVAARFWEFPQGSWEDRPDVDPAELARAELREEAGLAAGTLRRLGHLYEAYGFSTQGFDVWLASELGQVPVQRDAEEQDMRLTCVSRADWEDMIGRGEIKDAPSIAAYGLLLLRERAELDAQG